MGDFALFVADFKRVRVWKIWCYMSLTIQESLCMGDLVLFVAYFYWEFWCWGFGAICCWLFMGLFGLCITDAVKFALTFVINMETTHQVPPFLFCDLLHERWTEDRRTLHQGFWDRIREKLVSIMITLKLFFWGGGVFFPVRFCVSVSILCENNSKYLSVMVE